MSIEKLYAGIAAFKAGNKIAARKIMLEIIRAEPRNEIAWLWLAACVEKVQDRIYCLSKALEINPNNHTTRKALEQLEPPHQPSIEEIASVPQSQPDINYDILEESAGSNTITETQASSSSKIVAKRKTTTVELMLFIITLGLLCIIILGGSIFFINNQINNNFVSDKNKTNAVAQIAQYNAALTLVMESKIQTITNNLTETSSPTIPAPTKIFSPNIITTTTETVIPTITLLPTITLPLMEFAKCVPTNTERIVGKVTSVVDGDTIEVAIGENLYRIRYIGIDCPESTTSQEAYGMEATQKNKDLVIGKNVILIKDISETDKYNRLLRYVFVDNIFVNYELVAQGYANTMTYPPDIACNELFLTAEQSARNGLLGLWAPAAVEIPTASNIINNNCDPAYPTVCIPSPPPDLDCGDISFRRFQVLPPDPHRFDGDHDGIGCEK